MSAEGEIERAAREKGELDGGGAERRIGLITLATDLATEADFGRCLAGTPVAFNTARVLNVNPCTAENLRQMGPRLAASAATLLPGMPLDVIAYSCTSATVALGYETVRAQIAEGRPEIPVVTPATAALAAFKALGVTRVALVTPYLQELGEEVGAYLEAEGATVVRQTHFGFASDVDMAFLKPEAIRARAAEADHPEAEALFVSCTALRAMPMLEDLEAALGKPCLSSIQCLLWEAVRTAGYRAPIAGAGALLRL